MRKVRTIGVGLAALGCVLAAFSAPAFAHGGAPIEKHLFGNFVASKEGIAKGTGKVNELRIGPYKFKGPELFEEVEVENPKTKVKEKIEEPKKNPKTGEIEYGPLCKTVKGSTESDVKDLSASGKVAAGSSESITFGLKFNHCVAYRPAAEGSPLRERVDVSFKLGVEFHANQSVTLGEDTGEVKLKPEGLVVFKGSSAECAVEIESQTVPVKAGTEKGENEEFESALYATEEESTLGEKGKEKKYGPVHDTLDIEGEFSKVKTAVPTEESSSGKCIDRKGDAEEEEEFKSGVIDFELEEIALKDGNLSFVPAA